MTLQGVLILRITDFRRFFTFSEFWTKRLEFVPLFRDNFADTAEERLLMENLCLWIKSPDRELINCKIGGDSVSVNGSSFSFGRLSPYVKDAKTRMRMKDITGLTLLYLLLGANDSNSGIEIKYEIPDGSQFYNECYESRELPHLRVLPSGLYNLALKVFANRNFKDIDIRCGAETVCLKPGECVAGIFCNNECYCLNRNKFYRGNDITLQLVAGKNGPCIKTENGELIPDAVSAVPFEKPGSYAYVTVDGQIHYHGEGGSVLKNMMKKMHTKDSGKVLCLESARKIVCEHEILSI